MAYFTGDDVGAGTIHIVSLDGSTAEQTLSSDGAFDWQHFSQLASGH